MKVLWICGLPRGIVRDGYGVRSELSWIVGHLPPPEEVELHILCPVLGLEHSYCTLLLGGVIAFFCGASVTHDRLSVGWPWVSAVGFCVAVLVYAFLCWLVSGLYVPHVLFYWLSFFCAVFFAGWCLLSEHSLPTSPRLVGFVSSISYEIYLVHHPLCLGPLSLKAICPSILMYSLVFMATTIFFLSWLLHLAVACLYKWLK